MTRGDKIRRAIAFYLSVILFSALLPIILSYALGYKIDYRGFKIYKTGILYIASRPAGAAIFIDGAMHKDLTPTQIEELKPGNYKVEVRKEGFYPWEKELEVKPNMVTKAEHIVLFPISQEMKTINGGGVEDFLISDKNYIYYMKRSGLFRSDMDGNDMRMILAYGNWPGRIDGKKLSPNETKLLFFTSNSLWAANLQTGFERVDEVFTGHELIVDAFWYPSAGYIIVVTRNDIKVVELSRSGRGNIVSLYKFNSRPRNVSYNQNSGALYFTDTHQGPGAGASDYLYRLDFKQKFFDSVLQLLIKKEQDNSIEKR